MASLSAIREWLSLIASHERELFVCCVRLLIGCAVGSACIVMAQNKLNKGLDHVRACRVLSGVFYEWCLMVDSFVDFKIREGVRHGLYALGRWFQWKNLTFVGRLDTRLIKVIGLLGVALLGADSLEAAVRILELLYSS